MRLWFNEITEMWRIQKKIHQIPSGRSIITVKAQWILWNCASECFLRPNLQFYNQQTKESRSLFRIFHIQYQTNMELNCWVWNRFFFFDFISFLNEKKEWKISSSVRQSQWPQRSSEHLVNTESFDFNRKIIL
jgi:hypothetical protein